MLIRPFLLIASLAAALAFAGPASAAPPAKHHVAFTLRYSFSQDHFTMLKTDAPVKATVRRPDGFYKVTTLKALIGQKLQVGTKIFVRRGRAHLTLKITPQGVR